VPDQPEIVIIGAGPAGLTAAYMLAKRDVNATVLESGTVVGGISRTATRDGWRFDIGGHRFFTKVQPVEDLWLEILGPDDFLRRPRLSRVYYRGKFYDYPIVAMNALRNLGLVEALRCGLSYVWVRIRPPKDRTTLEGFVAGRFGWRLYDQWRAIVKPYEHTTSQEAAHRRRRPPGRHLRPHLQGPQERDQPRRPGEGLPSLRR
jgi:protoporphyrinogen oxidase